MPTGYSKCVRSMLRIKGTHGIRVAAPAPSSWL